MSKMQQAAIVMCQGAVLRHALGSQMAVDRAVFFEGSGLISRQAQRCMRQPEQLFSNCGMAGGATSDICSRLQCSRLVVQPQG